MTRSLLCILALAALCGCARQEPTATTVPDPRLDRAGTVPFRADVVFLVTNQVFAGVPSVDRGTFGGRCSVPSDWVVTASMNGEATHLGKVTGVASHCSQVEWLSTPGGPVPIAMAYTDGQAELVAANGDVLRMTYTEGTSTLGPTGGTFHDHFTLVGGTGRFAAATGTGADDGSFVAFDKPMPMKMVGRIAY